MNIFIFPRIPYLMVISLIAFYVISCQNIPSADKETASKKKFWKAGVSRINITPKDNLWLAGFAAREKPADGKLHDLWVKALVLEDANGTKALLVTTDIIGFSRELSRAVCQRIMDNHGLERKNIMLTASHTHSCPAVNKNLFGIYPPFDEEMKKNVEENLRFLEDRIVHCVNQAFDRLEPSMISSGIGIARFAVNRRENKESEVLHASDLSGPFDHSVPVIRVSDREGNPKTVLFGYACHATSLYGNQYSGDYPGFTQIELENSFPGLTAMFFAGCGGDQGCMPRGTVPRAEQYGNELAEAVKRVLKEPMKEQKPSLSTVYAEIDLPFSEPLSIRELNHIIETEHPYQKRWARKMIKKLTSGEAIPETYPFYPVQTWQLGNQTLLALGGEVVVDYAHRIRKEWGNDLFVAAYANDVMAYIPSVRVLKEGGYEGDYSMRAYGQPATWEPEVEELIIDEVARQMSELRKQTSGNSSY